MRRAICCGSDVIGQQAALSRLSRVTERHHCASSTAQRPVCRLAPHALTPCPLVACAMPQQSPHTLCTSMDRHDVVAHSLEPTLWYWPLAHADRHSTLEACSRRRRYAQPLCGSNALCAQAQATADWSCAADVVCQQSHSQVAMQAAMKLKLMLLLGSTLYTSPMHMRRRTGESCGALRVRTAAPALTAALRLRGGADSSITRSLPFNIAQRVDKATSFLC